MSSFDLICLGEPMVEFNQQSEGMYRIGIGGDVSNVAISASQHGARTAFISRLGKDIFGAEIIKKWQSEGVDYSNVESISGEETGVYFVTHGPEGHRFSYRRTNSAASKFQSSALPREVICASSVFYASGINLAISASVHKATLDAIHLAREYSTMVAFDPNLRTALWPIDQAREAIHGAFRYCDIALPSLEDAQQLTGLTNPAHICDFYHKLGPKNVVLTLGKNGVYLSEEGQPTLLPGQQVESVDATGAGDCFNGAFIATWIKTKCIKTAAEVANIAAAKSTTKFGALS